jgi:hypothetical protein
VAHPFEFEDAGLQLFDELHEEGILIGEQFDLHAVVLLLLLLLLLLLILHGGLLHAPALH